MVWVALFYFISGAQCPLKQSGWSVVHNFRMQTVLFCFKWSLCTQCHLSLTAGQLICKAGRWSSHTAGQQESVAWSPSCPWLQWWYHGLITDSEIDCQPFQAEQAVAGGTSTQSQEANCSLVEEVGFDLKGLLRTVILGLCCAVEFSEGLWRGLQPGSHLQRHRLQCPGKGPGLVKLTRWLECAPVVKKL